MSSNPNHLGARIRAIRKERKLTTEQLSEMTGISDVYIRQIEGQGKVPSLDFFVNICNALETDPLYFLQDSLTYTSSCSQKDLISFCERLSPKDCTKALSLLKVVFDDVSV